MTTRWSAFSPLIIKEYNSNLKVLLKCEQLEYFPSIVPEVYNINPPLENFKEELDKLCDKTEEILEAVQDCSEEEEQGKKVEITLKNETMKFHHFFLFFSAPSASECLNV